MGSSYRKRKMRDKEDLIPLGSRENSNPNPNPNPNPNIKVLLRVYVCVRGVGVAGENIRAKGLEEVKERHFLTFCLPNTDY